MEIRRFIVGVDGSVPSRAAIRWAITRAHERSGEVVFVHVADGEWGAMGTRLIDEIDQDTQQRLEGELAYARTLGESTSLHGQLRCGSPMAELASFSDARTMLVVGTHKTGFHYGRAYGSRSLQLANLVTGPVAIIPDVASRMRRGVVVGVDDTPAGYAAIDMAADLAGERHCELMAVRASTARTLLDTDHSDALHDWQLRRDDEARSLLAAALGRARRRQPDIVLRSRVVRRPAGAALNELSRGAELLLIGDSRRADAQLGSLGAVANDVLLNLSSPTIVVHAPEAARREWVQKREEEPMCSDEPVQGLDRDECRGASATGIPYEACTTPRGERG